MEEQPKALRLADELIEYVLPCSGSEHWDTLDAAAAELRRLHHNNEVMMNALMKACGDDEQMVKDYIESQGELK
jgi:hypothetical protein